ncbi:FAD-binding domain-containing protein [Pleomassaria siparia CBS 279.74]|uniref:FAD-binding domain-containing protein n=1 Tax=Pleomassaria siparia CBS 279.74 TaxID=1314801 RepID=A0A6G1JUP3_9PLEO|nr:FAD-binding domain-containing protein [Pleomassaria siparia CBS 279.74]
MSPRSILSIGLAIQTVSIHAAAYCLAGQACFPSDDVLATFEQSLGGNLIKTLPYGSACYSATYNAEECLKLANQSQTFDFRESQAAAVMYINNEITKDGEGCPVPITTADGSPPAAINGSCTLGNMPSYVVNVTCAHDVSLAVKFAAAHNLRLRIKNSGHDYAGRSAGKGALSIWTRHLNEAVLIEDFSPEGVHGYSTDVVSAGPGVNVEELNQWGADNARVTIGGYTPSVGATGGYLLGGGFGPTAPHFGMGVDNVVQFEVITADGDIKIANSAKNQDLFWALRGGGGAFGVVTHVWLKAYPALAAVNTVAGPVVCQDRASYEQMINTLIDLQVPLNDAGHSVSQIWIGHNQCAIHSNYC